MATRVQYSGRNVSKAPEDKNCTASIGILFTIQLIGTTVTKPVMGRLSDKYGRKQMISLGLVFGAIALGMIPFFRNFWTLIPTAILFGVSLATTTASTAAYVSDLAKAGSYGSALGVMSTIMDVGQSAGPIIASQLLIYGPAIFRNLLPEGEVYHYMAMFTIIAGLLLLAGAAFPTLAGKPKNLDK